MILISFTYIYIYIWGSDNLDDDDDDTNSLSLFIQRENSSNHKFNHKFYPFYMQCLFVSSILFHFSLLYIYIRLNPIRFYPHAFPILISLVYICNTNAHSVLFIIIFISIFNYIYIHREYI